MSSLQTKCRFIFNKNIQIFIVTIIILNAISLGIETSKNLPTSLRNYLEWFDTIVLCIYVTELVLKQIALGGRFWKNGWNVFDVLIVTLSLAPANGSLSILRGLRILRLFRVFSAFKPLRRIIVSLLKSIPSIGWLSLLVLINLYLFSVIGTNFFGDVFDDYFGTIGRSFFTLFQIMTLEGWADLARSILNEHEYAYIYFVFFILLNTFIMLNLFVGVIVSAMSEIDSELANLDKESPDKQIENESKDSNSDVDSVESEMLLKEQIVMLNKELNEIKAAIINIENHLNTRC